MTSNFGFHRNESDCGVHGAGQIVRMAGLSSLTVGNKIASAVRWVREAFFVLVVTLVSVSSLLAQSTSSVREPPPPKAIYTPAPTYRAEWVKQGLTGKGIVLVNIDKQTGKVTGARMLTSTGSQQLDGAALQAYSQWRFDPGTVAVSQLKIPIEFARRPAPQPPKRALPQAVTFLIILAVAGAVIGFLSRRRA